MRDMFVHRPTVHDASEGPKEHKVITGVAVWVTTDPEGENVVAGPLLTDKFGQVRLILHPIDEPDWYYEWRDHKKHSFNNPIKFSQRLE